MEFAQRTELRSSPKANQNVGSVHTKMTKPKTFLDRGRKSAAEKTSTVMRSTVCYENRKFLFLNAEYADSSQTTQKQADMCHLRPILGL